VSAAGENLHGERELAGGCEGRCGWKSGMPSRAATWMWTQPRSDSEPASRPTRGSWRPGQERPGDKRRQGPRAQRVVRGRCDAPSPEASRGRWRADLRRRVRSAPPARRACRRAPHPCPATAQGQLLAAFTRLSSLGWPRTLSGTVDNPRPASGNRRRSRGRQPLRS
jgi:hypothetical protein